MEAPHGQDHVEVWSFMDAARVVARARVFTPRFGVAKDEDCGSASMVLAGNLERPLMIRRGKGSEIFGTSRATGELELGGRVLAVEKCHRDPLASRRYAVRYRRGGLA
jgi:predicted PhzF superfamily epimerase YddE/YHI9